ncbi:hypothetical protein A9Q81_06805 [Gammaproteobacteria bacterium 42_54_T18]|nr:hypothetical protein A9Q81_06805 [Gammaproteobacteria bacterium 42_54_T18]
MNFRLMNRYIFSLLIVALSSVAFADSEEDNRISEKRILNKLAFISDCQVSDFKMQCLNYDINNDDLCSEFGVSGCEVISTYTDIADTWVMTATKSLQGAAIAGVIEESIIAQEAASQAALQSAAHASAMAANQAAASAAAASAAAASAAAAGAAAASAAAASAAAASAPPPPP